MLRSARKLTIASCVALSATATLVAGGSAVAQAQNDPVTAAGVTADCPLYYACFWVGKEFTNGRGRVLDANPDFRELPTSNNCPSGTWNDCISSIRNGDPECGVYFSVNFNYMGKTHSLAPGDEVPDFALAPPIGYSDPGFDNAISSNYWVCP